MRHLLIALSLLCFASPALAEGVVVSIKPLHSLVASVMEGSDITTTLLVNGKTSPHDFSLKPSQARALRKADIVFYMGDDFELFLARILPQLPNNTLRVPMEKAAGMTLYSIRNSRDDAHDMHAWLAPQNARAMVATITRALAEIYPEQAALFSKNAEALDTKLAKLDKNLAKRMGKLEGKTWAVFHDAFQYFDRAYSLNNIGAITLNPEHGLNARHVKELNARMKKTSATCLFYEPEFDSRIVNNLVKDTPVKSALLDPEATLLTPGPNLYFEMMENLASGLEGCLG